jgi:hypothetical protein
MLHAGGMDDYLVLDIRTWLNLQFLAIYSHIWYFDTFSKVNKYAQCLGFAKNGLEERTISILSSIPLLLQF